jgi:hypothetical protein
MTTVNPASGPTTNTSGIVGEPKTSDPSDQSPVNWNEVDLTEAQKAGTVAYPSFLKAVGEVKRFKSEAEKLREENEAFKLKEKEREDAALAKKGDFEKIKANLLKELEEEKQKAKSLKEERDNDRKLGAFLGSLGGSIAQDYWPLIDIEQIAIDPTTNSVDPLSVTRLVDDFRKRHGRLIDGVKGPKMFDGAPTPQGKIGLDEWRKLPLSERKARMKDAYESIKNKN